MLIEILDSNETPVLINPQYVTHFVRGQFGTVHIAGGEVITVKSNEIPKFLEGLNSYFSGGTNTETGD